ncbi:MAG: hypothetical protein OES47_02525 [Acidobacteriota bacterium]|nr:hypothetical protein [Acidobacteriota bacterium]
MKNHKLFSVGRYDLDEDLYFEPTTHLWVSRQADGRVQCGFDPLGAETSGDIVAVSFEAVGSVVGRGASLGHLEAAKFVGPVLAPVSGKIVAHNDVVLANPTEINRAPLERWLVELEPIDLEAELERLIHGREQVVSWFAAEIERFESKGMVAE